MIINAVIIVTLFASIINISSGAGAHNDPFAIFKKFATFKAP